MELSGGLKIANDTTSAPAAGTIRWSGSAFEGYDGISWVALDAPTTSLNGNIGLPVPLMKSAQVVYPSDNSGLGRFGSSVTIENTYAAVGAPASASGISDGHIYLLKYNGDRWTEVDKQAANDLTPGSAEIGSSIDMCHPYVATGAIDHSSDGSDTNSSGNAFVYEIINDSLVIMDTLSPPAAHLNELEEFGESIAISCSWAFVGDPNSDNGSASNEGKVFLYEKRDMSYEYDGVLSPIDTLPVLDFGASIDVSGDWAIVGAPLTDDLNRFSLGRVYMYHYNGSAWEQTQVIIPPDVLNNSKFGFSVSMDGDYVAVRTNPTIVSERKIYIYQRSNDTWLLKQSVNSGNSSSANNATVHINGDYMITGNPGSDDGGMNNSGDAIMYHFDEGQWAAKDTIAQMFPQEIDVMGESVSTDMINTIVGVPGKDRHGDNNVGSVLLFAVDPK